MKNFILALFIFGLTFSWAQEQEALVFFTSNNDIAASIAKPLKILKRTKSNDGTATIKDEIILAGPNNDQIRQRLEVWASLYKTPNDSLGYGISDFGKALLLGKQLGTQKVRPPQEFEVATNPVQKNITLIFPNNTEAVRCTLYDLLGTKIKSETLKPNANKMDVSDLSRGIYILTVKTEKGNKSFKIIKR